MSVAFWVEVSMVEVKVNPSPSQWLIWNIIPWQVILAAATTDIVQWKELSRWDESSEVSDRSSSAKVMAATGM